MRYFVFLVVFCVGLALTVGVPVWAMVSCTDWNEGMMDANMVCTPDWAVTRWIANQVTFFVVISSFMIGIPILVYLGVVGAIFVFIAKRAASRF